MLEILRSNSGRRFFGGGSNGAMQPLCHRSLPKSRNSFQLAPRKVGSQPRISRMTTNDSERRPPASSFQLFSVSESQLFLPNFQLFLPMHAPLPPAIRQLVTLRRAPAHPAITDNGNPTTDNSPSTRQNVTMRGLTPWKFNASSSLPLAFRLFPHIRHLFLTSPKCYDARTDPIDEVSCPAR